MKPDSTGACWQRIDELFTAALKREGPERDAFLAESCRGDDALRQEVESLLKAHVQATGFMQSAVFDEGIRLIAEKNQADSLAGQTIEHYEILEEIGRGGMGVIYRARQRHSRRIVALKRVLSYSASSHEPLTRFRREAEAAASLDHPNILPIYEIGETADGLPFFSMKFATGGSLRTVASALRGKPRPCYLKGR